MNKSNNIPLIAFITGLILIAGITTIYYIAQKPSEVNTTNETNDSSETAIEIQTEGNQTPKPLIEDFRIEGVTGIDGSGNQWPLFTANSCRIVDSISGTTAVNCASCTVSTESVADSKICLHAYSNLIRGPKASNGQYFFMYGAEGGGGGVDIYFVSSADSKLTLIDKVRQAGIPPFDEQTTIENAKYKEQTAKYNFDYYKDLAFPNDSEACKFPNEKNPECTITIKLYNTAKCTAPTADTIFSKEFATECFTNWNDLTAAQQNKLIENLQDQY
jgi:hypothetical protein